MLAVLELPFAFLDEEEKMESRLDRRRLSRRGGDGHASTEMIDIGRDRGGPAAVCGREGAPR